MSKKVKTTVKETTLYLEAGKMQQEKQCVKKQSKNSLQRNIKKLLKQIDEFKLLYDNKKTNYHQHELVNGLARWLNKKLENVEDDTYDFMIMNCQGNMQNIPFYVELLDDFVFDWITLDKIV